MQLTKEERLLRNSTAASFASLSIGLWTIVLIGYTTSISNSSWTTYYSAIAWATIPLIILGGLSILFGLYLMLCWDWKQKSVLSYLDRTQTTASIKLIAWLIVLTVFALRLIQTGNVLLYLTGIATFVIAFIIFYVGLFKMGKENN